MKKGDYTHYKIQKVGFYGEFIYEDIQITLLHAFKILCFFSVAAFYLISGNMKGANCRTLMPHLLSFLANR